MNLGPEVVKFGEFLSLLLTANSRSPLSASVLYQGSSSESRLCRLERSVSKQLHVIICSAEVIIFYSKLEHSVDSNAEMLLP